jgi:gamma-glutamyl hercynylcysteine S-oxide synthase
MTGMGLAGDLDEARERTLALVAHLPAADLERQVHPLMSPLVWDLAHIAAYEDLWLAHRAGGLPLLREDLAATYDAFETPRAVRGEIELLDAGGARAYLAEVRERARPFAEGELAELVLRHELQHTETMRQAMRLGGLEAPGEDALPGPMGGEDGWVELEGGPFAMGAGPEGFAYDNERPRHEVELAPFRIARRPVSNATWLTFTEGGGYVRREWWSDEGWAWKQDYDIGECPRAAAAHPDAPVCHVSWFEADALARSLGARLPTEAEWERASASDQLDGTSLVWEWTASDFTGYPGFVAHPYREYSEVFFGPEHRVLRGGSWATHPRVASPTFRNWDLPQRRQLFAGLRLAC